MVNGHCVKASPPKTTKPILSLGRASIKSASTSLATANRFGLKSFASIDKETSRLTTISIPSVLVSFQLLRDCGRAIARINNE